jgi:hypothetical protein
MVRVWLLAAISFQTEISFQIISIRFDNFSEQLLIFIQSYSYSFIVMNQINYCGNKIWFMKTILLNKYLFQKVTRRWAASRKLKSFRVAYMGKLRTDNSSSVWNAEEFTKMK